MKRIIILIILLNCTFLFSQVLKVELDDEYLIFDKISKLEKGITNYNFNKILNNSFYIKVDSLYHGNNIATANCTIYFSINGDIVKYKNEKISLTKNSKWEIEYENLGDWYSIIHKQITNLQGTNNKSTSIGDEISIHLSESSFITYPFNNAPTEIGSDYTKSKLGVQLFKHGSKLDGGFYDVVTGYETGFVIDPDWRRIIYGKQTSLFYADFKAFNSTENHPLSDMTAIAVKSDGSIFVSDIASSQISRFLYNPSSHTISIPSNSIFLDNTKIQKPTDIELSISGEYLYVCDKGSKSIKKFDMDGNLIIEITGDQNYTLNKPLFIQPYEDSIFDVIVVIDQDTYGNYYIITFYTKGPPAGASGYYRKFPQGSKPADLSQRWDDCILITDAGLNMIHLYNGDYLCSFNGTSDPTQSMFTYLGKMPTMYMNHKTNTINLQNIVFDSWGSQDGFNQFYTGVDLLDLAVRNVSKELQTATIDYTLTSAAKPKYELIRVRDNMLMYSQENIYTYPGRQGYFLNLEGYENDIYKLRITAEPLYNDYYDYLAVPPITKEIIFAYPQVQQLGTQISSNTSLDGIYVCDGTTISNNAILTIQPGTIIRFRPNKGIDTESGSRIIANGTSSNRIQFIRDDENLKWGTITLKGGSNSFSYCDFDGGGTYAVKLTASMNNIIDNCIFQNNDFGGLNAGEDINDAGSSFKMSNCIIKNNGGSGIEMYYSKGEIVDSHIFNNGTTYGWGIYMWNSQLGYNGSHGIGLFKGNEICNNGGYGVEIGYNSQLWLGYSIEKGLNAIRDNNSHEILISSTSSTARLYQSSVVDLSNTGGGTSASGGGYSDIYDSNLGYYIYNMAQTYDGEAYVSLTQKAELNYWGSSIAPSSTRFFGSVDYYPYKTISERDLIYPKTNPSNDNTIKSIISADIIEKLATHSKDDEELKFNFNLKQFLIELRNNINNSPNDLINARRLNELYTTFVHEDPENTLGERLAIFLMLNKFKNSFQTAALAGTITNKQRLLGEVATLMILNDLIYFGYVDYALAIINKVEVHFKNSDNIRELFLHKLHIYKTKGELENCLDIISDLREIVIPDTSSNDDYTPPNYDLVESHLTSLLGDGVGASSKNLSKLAATDNNLKPKVYALHQNYPNPFNPSTKISFSLPEQSKVKIEIFDITGSRVFLFNEETYSPGNYSINFDAGNYSSGVYFVRAIMSSAENKSTNMFTRKMLLIK